MEKIYFTKMTGAGNDFILIDKNKNIPFALSDKVIRNICDRRFGIGGDGLIVVSEAIDVDFEMFYYNSDGSTGTLCGNGARCAIRFCFENNIIENKTIFKSNGSIYSGQVLDDEQVRFLLNDPKDLRKNIQLKHESYNINAHFLNTGSPHIVINIDEITLNGERKFQDMEAFPVNEFGRSLRYNDEFQPAGCNVNFISLKDDGISLRTYERGVEDETLACGTGATASAIICNLVYGYNPSVSVLTHGKHKLEVDFKNNAQTITNVSLTGPAKSVFTGEFALQKFF